MTDFQFKLYLSSLIVITCVRSERVFATDQVTVTGRSQVEQRLNRSSGTWANLENAWDYFPPADASGRQSMLRWSADLYKKADSLEKEIIVRSRTGRADQIINGHQVRQELIELKNSAYLLHRTLLYGAHRGDLAEQLEEIQTKLDLIRPEMVREKQAEQLETELSHVVAEIKRVSGPRLTMTAPNLKGVEPVLNSTKSEKVISPNRIGLSRGNR